ncbi:DnaD domain-containing protein [Amedibacillus sp. YH-ame10]
MEKWWKEKWVDRRSWVLDHLEELSLNSNEVMCVLLIDFMNEHKIAIRHGILAQKLKVDGDSIDEILTQLSAKGYLQIEYQNGHIHFDIDGIFEDDSKKSSSFDYSLFDLFETEFGRTLSQIEVQRLADWLNAYDQKMIGYALREALTYDHKSFDYIERILVEWKKKNLTAEDYEEGKR